MNKKLRWPASNSYTSAATEVVEIGGGAPDGPLTLVLEVIEAVATWSGILKVAARIKGAAEDDGATTYTDYLGITNRDTGTVIDGDTGITAVGLYEVSIIGLEVQLEHTRTSGTVKVRHQFVIG